MTKQTEHPIINLDEVSYQEISYPAVMSKEPLVSVKMSTYNHKPYIAQAIEGVVMQETSFPFELIIGEDCSTDGTREIVMEYQKRHPEITRVITSEHNVGMRRNGLRMSKACRGKYIAWCEGDDYWTHQKKLQKQVDILESQPEVVMVAHRANIVDADNKLLTVRPSMQSAILDPKYIIARGGSSFETCSMILRTSLLANLPDWFRSFPVGDVALVNLSINRGKIYFIGEIMSTYRKGVPGSWTSHQESVSVRLDHLISMVKAYRCIARQEKKYKYLYYKRICSLYLAIQRMNILRVIRCCLDIRNRQRARP